MHSSTQTCTTTQTETYLSLDAALKGAGGRHGADQHVRALLQVVINRDWFVGSLMRGFCWPESQTHNKSLMCTWGACALESEYIRTCLKASIYKTQTNMWERTETLSPLARGLSASMLIPVGAERSSPGLWWVGVTIKMRDAE